MIWGKREVVRLPRTEFSSVYTKFNYVADFNLEDPQREKVSYEYQAAALKNKLK